MQRIFRSVRRTQYGYIACKEGWIKDVCSVHARELARKVELYIIIILYVYFREIGPTWVTRNWLFGLRCVWKEAADRVYILCAFVYNIMCRVQDLANTPNPPYARVHEQLYINTLYNVKYTYRMNTNKKSCLQHKFFWFPKRIYKIIFSEICKHLRQTLQVWKSLRKYMTMLKSRKYLLLFCTKITI